MFFHIGKVNAWRLSLLLLTAMPGVSVITRVLNTNIKPTTDGGLNTKSSVIPFLFASALGLIFPDVESGMPGDERAFFSFSKA